MKARHYLMMPAPLATVAPGAVHPAAVLVQLQFQLQQLGGGLDWQQDGVGGGAGGAGGDDASSVNNGLYFLMNQIVDGDIALDPNLQPAPVCSTCRVISPVHDPPVTSSNPPATFFFPRAPLFVILISLSSFYCSRLSALPFLPH